jgi:hypothetical protein
MKAVIGLIFLWLAAGSASAQTNQAWDICRNPVRSFGAHEIVNLTPLFQWWARQPLPGATNASLQSTTTNAPEVRPLSAWRRVTGTPLATTGNSWLVAAVIYTSPTISTNARIILRNPPVQEEQTYLGLRAQLADVSQQITSIQQVYQAAVKAEQADVARAEAYQRSWDKVAPTGVVKYSRLAEQKHKEAALAASQQDQLEAVRNGIESQLKPIPAANGSYLVDWFAVEAGHTKQGVPIYDLGMVSPNPP